MIYTSYYANVTKYPEIRPISIALYPPYYFKGDTFVTLAPPAELIMDYKANKIDQDTYTFLYNKKLSKLDPNEILNRLNFFISGEKPIALCCYETPDQFCHRHLVAAWLNNYFTTVKVPYSVITELPVIKRA